MPHRPERSRLPSPAGLGAAHPPRPRATRSCTATRSCAGSRSSPTAPCTMGPGTLYGAVKRMLADGLIEETAERPDPALDDQRRRYYRVTALGARGPRRGGRAARDAAQERTAAERVMRGDADVSRPDLALPAPLPARVRRRDDPALHRSRTRPRTTPFRRAFARARAHDPLPVLGGLHGDHTHDPHRDHRGVHRGRSRSRAS